MSDWIYDQLRYEMRWRVGEHPNPETLLIPNPPPDYDWPGMDPREREIDRFHHFLVGKYALRHGQIDAKTAARLCGISEDLAGYMLRSLSRDRYMGEYGREYLTMYSTRRGPVFAFRDPEEGE